jgi:hypothetical protein
MLRQKCEGPALRLKNKLLQKQRNWALLLISLFEVELSVKLVIMYGSEARHTQNTIYMQMKKYKHTMMCFLVFKINFQILWSNVAEFNN